MLATGDFQLGKSFSTLGASAKDFRAQLLETAKVVPQAHDADLVLVAGDVLTEKPRPPETSRISRRCSHAARLMSS